MEDWENAPFRPSVRRYPAVTAAMPAAATEVAANIP
jgi:hypothetical protein